MRSISARRNSARLAILAAICALIFGYCDSASARSRLHGLTAMEAETLAELAVRHQIEGIRNKGNFSLEEFVPEPDDSFYTFEALGVWSPGLGSAVIGHYSVNKKTGDVWDLFACKRLKFRALRDLQERYVHGAGPAASKIKNRKWARLALRPVLCDF